MSFQAYLDKVETQTGTIAGLKTELGVAQTALTAAQADLVGALEAKAAAEAAAQEAANAAVLQGIVEYFGGSLRTLAYPMHGKQSALAFAEGFLFEGIQQPMRVGRYHSLVADRVPEVLEVCARTADGCVMVLNCR